MTIPDIIMKLGHIELFAHDTAAAGRFYLDVLGFELVAAQDGGFIWLKLGDCEILLRPGAPPASASSYRTTAAGMVLYTDDLPGTTERLRERGLEFRGTDGSEDCLTFTDPDGNWFQLVDPAMHH
ncbi:MAG: glyoxalase [Chlorobi bacterium]|nr:glyoxalase [Chlorobiota bacterium]